MQVWDHRYLGGDIDLGSFTDQQGGHVCVALLRGQVERSDTLLGQDVGVCAVLQQHSGNVHLVLFSRNVQRSVAILGGQTRGVSGAGSQMVFNVR